MTGEFLMGADGRELDRIALVGLLATGYHGVLASERRDGQTFGADVVLHLDTRAAAATDDLGLTVNYADLAADVVEILTGEPVDLIETLAQRIADAALGFPGVEVVDVVVHKPHAPIDAAFDDVRVAIRRRRPATDAPAGLPAVAVVVLDEDDLGPLLPEEPSAAEVSPAPTPGAGPVAGPVAAVAEEQRAPDPLDAPPAGEVAIVLALGGNVGDVRGTLRRAIHDLDAVEGISITAVSPLARTAAVGPEQEDFLNAVALGWTTLSPRDLLAATSAIEDAHGRVREERWGPRTLDIDIVTIEGVVSADPVLTLPHPRAHERAFVLVPWAQADPDAVLPGLGGGPVAALAETAPDRAGIRWLALDWFEAPEPPADAEPPVDPGPPR